MCARGGYKLFFSFKVRMTALENVAARLDTLTCRMEAALRRECDCSLAQLQRENERLRALLRANPPPRPQMLPLEILRVILSLPQQNPCWILLRMQKHPRTTPARTQPNVTRTMPIIVTITRCVESVF